VGSRHQPTHELSSESSPRSSAPSKACRLTLKPPVRSSGHAPDYLRAGPLVSSSAFAFLRNRSTVKPSTLAPKQNHPHLYTTIHGMPKEA
jgi:hypothetical protein